MTTCPQRKLVDRHFAASITTREERILRDHLPGCDACRARYERYLLLARLDRSVPPASQRIARGLGVSPRRRWIVAPLAAGLSVAAIAAVLMIPRGRAPEFTPRGGAQDRAGQAVRVYRIAGPGTTAQPIFDGAIRSGDELAFAYENQHGWKRLLIYATDATGRRYWYHPAWTDPAATPVATAIEPGAARRELPEAVAQPLPLGRVWLHAVFTDEAIDVRTIERGTLPAHGEEITMALEVTAGANP
jgi:hypothetical protein